MVDARTVSDYFHYLGHCVSTYQYTETTERFSLGASWNGAREREHARRRHSIVQRVLYRFNSQPSHY